MQNIGVYEISWFGGNPKVGGRFASVQNGL